jgi:hypothetical protein
MIKSIRIVETTMRRPCWEAMSPDGFITTVLQPASKMRGRRSNPRRDKRETIE